jgi:hypothetical protein
MADLFEPTCTGLWHIETCPHFDVHVAYEQLKAQHRMLQDDVRAQAKLIEGLRQEIARLEGVEG